MDCAAEWGKPPYEVFGGSKTLWWFRWKVRRELVMKANKEREKHGKQNRN
jgi:hypothetical protein